MSWLDKIQNIQLTIVTGDGNEYKPLWKDAKKNINFNTEGFDFIGVRGTFVERKEKQGTQYPILLWFQGADCIDVANNFEISSRDKRAWKIKHPFYDDIIVQPLSLEFDNSQLNVVKITGTLWETILQKFPDEKISPEKEIIVKKEETDITTEAIFTNDIGTPAPESSQIALSSINSITSNYETITESSEGLTVLKDLTRTASAAAQELILQPTRYIREAINLINFPFLIVQDIEQKINALLTTIDDFVFIFLDKPTDDSKIMYETQSTTLYTELSRNIIQSDESDYLTRSSVIDVVNLINESYDSFLENIDNNEITQDNQLSQDLDYIINLALARLFDIAFEAKQERIFILEKEDNIINLSHRFLGPGDDNIDLFVSQNSITLNEYLGLKKGRKILYYV